MRTILSLLLVMISIASAFAQITITSADLTTRVSVGNTLTQRSDTLTRSLNIGALGSTSWNFSALNNHTAVLLRSVTTTVSPFLSQFPGTTHVFTGTLMLQGITGTLYQHLTLGGSNLLNRGSGALATGQPIQLKTTLTPPEVVYQVPLTNGTTWTSAYVDTTIISLGGLPISTTITSHTVTNTVDAFGPMTLPGGAVFQALRIRTDNRTSGGRTRSYQFVAANGAAVTITASDTLQSNTGTINVSSVAWNRPIPDDVRISDAIPSDFALMQNYPNPFNPSTRITYQVAREGFVSIKVFNLVGQEVATLIGESKSPGTYALDWSADGIPTGAYFYTMQSASFTSTRRMLVLK